MRTYAVRGLKTAARSTIIRRELTGMRLFIDTATVDRSAVQQTLAQVAKQLQPQS